MPKSFAKLPALARSADKGQPDMWLGPFVSAASFLKAQDGAKKARACQVLEYKRTLLPGTRQHSIPKAHCVVFALPELLSMRPDYRLQ